MTSGHDATGSALEAELDGLRRERDRLEAELATVRTNRDDLVRRMHHAVEEERRRIAVDLHNRPVQELVGIGYQLERITMGLDGQDPRSAYALIDEAADQLVNQLEAIRLIISDLRPPHLGERGLVGAMASLASRIRTEQPDLEVRITGGQDRLGVETETVLFRIAQEALNNVVRHAEATVVTVDIAAGASDVEMTVRDDGSGFDVGDIDAFADQGRYGIAAMRDRIAMIGGEIDIASSGTGTTVACRAPRLPAATPGPTS